MKNHQAVDVVVNVFDKAIEEAYNIERAMCASGIFYGKSAELAKREVKESSFGQLAAFVLFQHLPQLPALHICCLAVF